MRWDWKIPSKNEISFPKRNQFTTSLFCWYLSFRGVLQKLIKNKIKSLFCYKKMLKSMNRVVFKMFMKNIHYKKFMHEFKNFWNPNEPVLFHLPWKFQNTFKLFFSYPKTKEKGNLRKQFLESGMWHNKLTCGLQSHVPISEY